MRDIYTFYEVETGTAYAFGTKSSETRLLSLSFLYFSAQCYRRSRVRMKRLTLADILVTVLISFIFGIIYKMVGLTVAALKPLGLHLDQIAYGLWFIAAIVAFLIIRKPGVAILAELAAGAGETILSGELNMSIIMHSLAQGLACELIFLILNISQRKHLLPCWQGQLQEFYRSCRLVL